VSFDSPKSHPSSQDSQQFKAVRQSQGSLMGYEKIVEHNTRLLVDCC
jgi:hypothetical protein